MSNNISLLDSNNTDLQAILATINALPEAGSGGVELPELANEGISADLLLNKELIDSEGNKVVGTMPNNGSIGSTMDGINVKSISVPAGYTSGGTVSLDNTIDDEVDIQTTLITQIVSALEGKAAGGSTGGASMTSGEFTHTEEMGFEPGTYNYQLVSSELSSSSRRLIIVFNQKDTGFTNVYKVFHRDDLAEEFVEYPGSYSMVTAGTSITISDNEIDIENAGIIDSEFQKFLYIAV